VRVINKPQWARQLRCLKEDLEQCLRLHKRIYAALKQEFKLLARVFKLYLPPEYPYDVVGGQRVIKQSDFDDRVDILPVADPNIFSQTQRISLAQSELQLAASNPAIHNQYQVYRNMYEALGVKDIDKFNSTTTTNAKGPCTRAH